MRIVVISKHHTQNGLETTSPKAETLPKDMLDEYTLSLRIQSVVDQRGQLSLYR